MLWGMICPSALLQAGGYSARFHCCLLGRAVATGSRAQMGLCAIGMPPAPVSVLVHYPVLVSVSLAVGHAVPADLPCSVRTRARSGGDESVRASMLIPVAKVVPVHRAPLPHWEHTAFGPLRESKRRRVRPWRKRTWRNPSRLARDCFCVHPMAVHVCVTCQHLSASTAVPWLPRAATTQLKASQEMK